MRGPLYEEVHYLTIQLVEAKSENNTLLASDVHMHMKSLCECYEKTTLDHPFQWETLGDFASTDAEALAAYQKSVECAERIGLFAHAEKIKLVIAELHFEQGNLFEAYKFMPESLIEIAKKVIIWH